MATNDGRRESHYNQQRSSLRSNPSSHTPSGTQSRPHSRPASGQLASAYTIDHDDRPFSPHSATNPDSPSPAPVVPRIPQRRQSLDKRNRSRSKSGTASSRSRNIEELLFPDADAPGLDEIEAPAPVQDPNRYEHLTLEGQRREPPQPQRHRFSFIPGRGTPGTVSSLTALPNISSRGAEQGPAYSRAATQLYTISYLILFSILGTLARLGVQWLTFYPGAPSTFPVLWANFGGTLCMGFLSQDQRLFRQEWGNRAPTPPHIPLPDEEKASQQRNRASSHAKIKKTIPLYVGLATGFCGSFTSFSSFMRDVFLAFLNDLRAPDAATIVGRNDGYSFMAGLAVIIITISASVSALKIGAHIALLLDGFTPTLPFRLTRRVVDPLIVVIAWGAWLGAVFMAIWPPDRFGSNETWRGQAVFACVFAPAGCLLRFFLSLKLNPLIPSFPLGTFAVNIFGTAVLGMAYDLQHIHISGSGIGGGRVGCQVLQGIMDGFDGCLTTVSTWILEIEGMKRGHAWKYAGASVVAGVAVLVAVMGSVRWSEGWTAAACVTGRSW